MVALHEVCKQEIHYLDFPKFKSVDAKIMCRFDKVKRDQFTFMFPVQPFTSGLVLDYTYISLSDCLNVYLARDDSTFILLPFG